uniref:Uncharacterized protein n=1 Tax=Setaria italica TaxID=4555 RepID=K3YXF2_SETIT
MVIRKHCQYIQILPITRARRCVSGFRQAQQTETGKRCRFRCNRYHHTTELRILHHSSTRNIAEEDNQVY